jgi:Domain of unknown function (DUF4430)
VSRAWAAALAAAALAVAAGGCGLGSGDAGDGEATLRITRDYGAELIAEATIEDPPESETVIRVLDREADLETRYGGGFVQSIDGLAGGAEGGRSLDWFFFVNGVESSVGAAQVPVRSGDRIWWDHRDWTDVMRVPAVVGSFPEPLVQASASDPEPVSLECAGVEAACAAAGERLAEAGIDFTNERLGAGEGAPRVLVGTWEDLRKDETASVLEGGPAESGVFTRPVKLGREWALQAFDASASPDDVLSDGGLVAALRPAEDPPAWVVTGTDAAGLDAAVGAVEEESLAGRYALALILGKPVALPIERAGSG